jgi:hypothetical protein
MKIMVGKPERKRPLGRHILLKQVLGKYGGKLGTGCTHGPNKRCVSIRPPSFYSYVYKIDISIEGSKMLSFVREPSNSAINFNTL